MPKLSDIPFPPILDTSSGDIIRDFFNPALAASVRYDRGVGFFSASWLSASVRLFVREKRLAVIITVPYQHLVDQWNTESRSSTSSDTGLPEQVQLVQ